MLLPREASAAGARRASRRLAPMALCANMAMGIHSAMCKERTMPVADRGVQGGAEFENIVAEAFRKAGWRVRRHPAAGDMRVDLVVDHGAKKYVVEVKSAPDGPRDRFIPLLSQA